MYGLGPPLALTVAVPSLAPVLGVEEDVREGEATTVTLEVAVPHR